MGAVAVRAVGLGVDAEHAGYVRALDEAAIEQVLTDIVEFVGEDPAGDADGVVGLFADDAVEHFGEPPNTCVSKCVPFLCHWFLTANIDRLISTQL